MKKLRRSAYLAAFALLALTQTPATAQEGDGEDEVIEESADDGGDEGANGDQPPPDQPPPDAGKKTPEPTSEGGIDVDGLRQEYLKLRDRLFRSRARAAAVATALYSTRVSIGLDYTSGRYYSINRATIRLDGANVYDNSDGAIATDKAPRFEGYIAPGRHVLTMRIEATGKDDDRFVSTVESSFVVQAVAGRDLLIRARAKDGGNIPYNWKKKKRGSYKLHLDVSVRAAKRGKGSGRIKRASN